MTTRVVFIAFWLLTAFAFGPRSAGATNILIPAVEITSLGHRYFPSINNPPFTEIHDQVDLPCGSGLGSCSSPGFSAAILNGDTIEIRFEAPTGEQFRVFHDPGLLVEVFQLYPLWISGTGDIASVFSPATISFENLSGTAPTGSVETNQFFVGNSGLSVGGSWRSAVTGDFTFTAVSFVFSVNNSPPGSLAAFGSAFSDVFPSFAVSGLGAPGYPDETLMQLEAIPEPAPGLLLAVGVALLAAGRRGRRPLQR
jgi:hypothetical protein